MTYKSMNDLGIPVPASKTLIIRTIKDVTVDQRSIAQKETEYNVFSFPADLLVVDFLSDSGTTSMTDLQWASMFHGDESYGRNKGYYVLLDAIRDTFERGDNPKFLLKHILNDEQNVDLLLNDLYLTNFEGGFVNGGVNQLIRPNAFIVPQGRAAEYLLFSTLKSVLDDIDPNKIYYIPSNGHFDTTEANIAANGIEPVNLFSDDLLGDFDYASMDEVNPFKGDINLEKLEKFIEQKNPESIPLIYLTITNNTGGGQPVSIKNIQAVKQIADRYSIPLFLDACRFAENAIFIKSFEPGYQINSIKKIIKETFELADGFTISFKKDGMSNMGGGLFFRDKGLFHKKYSINDIDIGIRLKEKQILTFGNDSYGGLSGRDIMALTAGLYEIVKESYLRNRIFQVREFARKLSEAGIPIILPAGGHAIYLKTDNFLEGTGMKTEDFGGVGITIELIKHYGIRAAELGAFAFEWDKKTDEQRKGIVNLVRFAIPRNAYSPQHIDYTVEAINEVYKNKNLIPRVKITRGAHLRLRHFQSGLEPIYLPSKGSVSRLDESIKSKNVLDTK
jgi:tryptophanase